MNTPTIIVLCVVVLIISAIIGVTIYNKKHKKGGGCGCGRGCSGCAFSDSCHPTNEQK